MRRSPAVLLLALAACGGPDRIHVQALVPGLDGRPVPSPGIAVVALPYDRDSVLRDMESKAATPRPSTALLDSLHAAFRTPFAALAEADGAARRLADSATALERALAAMSPTDPGHRDLAARSAQVAAARAAAEKRRDSAQAAVQRARAAFGPASDSVRRALKGWEDSTYRDYQQVTEFLSRRVNAPPLVDTTRADGGATLVLPAGRWWLYARAWDAQDPNAEWYWNVPVQGDTVVLSPVNGRRRPRY